MIVGTARSGGGTGFRVVLRRLVPVSENVYFDLYFALYVDENATVVSFLILAFAFPNKRLANPPVLYDPVNVVLFLKSNFLL